jgi:hypothetical protein
MVHRNVMQTESEVLPGNDMEYVQRDEIVRAIANPGEQPGCRLDVIVGFCGLSRVEELRKSLTEVLNSRGFRTGFVKSAVCRLARNSRRVFPDS